MLRASRNANWYVGPGQGYFQFASCSDVICLFGLWPGKDEDIEADDWEVVEAGASD